ncbi:hypothetical protein EYF80_053523 [Liparis tanakae]|uniref:Uncharacterized protein n=1 Tax=Liparis tanakae TaxID=230148 RepID=A0A4Z2F6D1_9TELE|nr:hypothetical protein EYF80_053523 [Liparis tanakae]
MASIRLKVLLNETRDGGVAARFSSALRMALPWGQWRGGGGGSLHAQFFSRSRVSTFCLQPSGAPTRSLSFSSETLRRSAFPPGLNLSFSFGFRPAGRFSSWSRSSFLRLAGSSGPRLLLAALFRFLGGGGGVMVPPRQ